jgi:DNA-binding NarL/FixJ family response regulator
MKTRFPARRDCGHANSGTSATVNVSLDSVPLTQVPASQPGFAVRAEVHERVIGVLFDLGWQNQEIAAALKVNPSRVSQIKQQAILKLRRRLQGEYRGRAA